MSRLVHPTVEAKWWANTRRAGRHLVWTGPLSGRGCPVLDYKGRRYQAARIAYRMRTGREPIGLTQRTCRTLLCVNPACIDDGHDRALLRTQLRALDGLPSPTTGTCDRGHDKAIHWRIRPNGKTYCNACAVNRKRERRGATT
jgi:hypothetical protein